MAKRLIIAVASTVLASTLLVSTSDAVKKDDNLESGANMVVLLQRSTLDQLNQDLELRKQKVSELEKQLSELNQRNASLEEQIQSNAKKDEEQPVAPAAQQAPVVQQTPAVSGVISVGDRQPLMQQAGIADFENANYLISRESGWNPNAVNPHSGACGLGQQLPCGKWARQWDDPLGALIDMNNYVIARYGSWANAAAHSRAIGWY